MVESKGLKSAAGYKELHAYYTLIGIELMRMFRKVRWKAVTQ